MFRLCLRNVLTTNLCKNAWWGRYSYLFPTMFSPLTRLDLVICIDHGGISTARQSGLNWKREKWRTNWLSVFLRMCELCRNAGVRATAAKRKWFKCFCAAERVFLFEKILLTQLCASQTVFNTHTKMGHKGLGTNNAIRLIPNAYPKLK